MVTLFARHKVADYTAWRKAYDEAQPMQEAGGVIAEAVYQSADNPNEVTVTHDFETLDAARAFMEHDDLKAAMTASGVVGEPTVWFANKV